MIIGEVMKKNILYLLLSTTLLLAACSKTEKEPQGSVSGGMKCGAGKCGANMFDGRGALAKKRKNILSQMREDDPRKACVIAAKTTKEAYNCVRSPQTNRLTLKCGTKQKPTKQAVMRCGAGKCGSAMK